MQNFSDSVAESIRKLSAVYFSELASHIAEKTGYDEDKLTEAISTYTGSTVSSIRRDAFLPTYKVDDKGTLTIGKCLELFQGGGSRSSFYVKGTTGRNHVAYPILSEFFHSLPDKGSWGFRKSLNPKNIPFLIKNPGEPLLVNVWIFPSDLERVVRDKLDAMKIEYTVDNRYAETEVYKVVSSPSPSEQDLKKSSDEILNATEDKPKKPTAKPKAKAKAKPKAKPVKKLSGKFIKRKLDGFYYNKDHKLLFEVDTDKQYPDKYLCVGSAETIKDERCTIDEDDMNLLKEHGIKWRDDAVEEE